MSGQRNACFYGKGQTGHDFYMTTCLCSTVVLGDLCRPPSTVYLKTKRRFKNKYYLKGGGVESFTKSGIHL